MQALRVFADSQLFRTVMGDENADEGISADDVDNKVAEILSVF